MSPRLRRSTRPFPPDETLPEPVRPAGLVLDARLHLLDRQTLDVDDVPVATVDDLEIGPPGSSLLAGTDSVFVTALLSGPVLATRIFGGRPPASRLHRIDWRHVTDVGTTVRLGVHGDSLDVLWVERWVRDHVIGRIPGGRHDPG
ncbi:hypothetical protein Cch01nite_36640 [Cellulomonas chitinilytica]|uniref:Uncharacterized protein n=1 Tax=Cellulomonas chitinilytica TaxID=398759 RepID=A0A919U0J3_9CELL|nr:hypothetical protein [Cellulomonas chitinilytica]GIG22940.1 hypothetical protein Cch01nite_36640 [Cellulomonas chitinilytica]